MGEGRELAGQMDPGEHTTQSRRRTRAIGRRAKRRGRKLGSRGQRVDRDAGRETKGRSSRQRGK
jgi:hypothetical protein